MMTHFTTIDELEKEIGYLREQNQKLINELSRVVKENSGFREELAFERRRLHQILGEEAGEKYLDENSRNHKTGRGEGDDLFCLN